ncbi:MAG: HD domain-containing protein [Rhizobacter sp.]|nr:HD domain-containing protein [Bacteriovorax sp.]
MTNFEEIFSEKILQVLGTKDPAHDLAHVKRVVSVAKKLAGEENANLEVVVPAAWLHDLVNLAKDHPQRKQASQMAADEAILFLKNVQYPEKYFDGIHHAIVAHSFSAGIKPETIEAKIVQDADRLDALGAIGLARLFSITTQLNRPFYDERDPFAEKRELDDKLYGIDHIHIKLKKISETMNTKSASMEALRRFKFIETYLIELKSEI